MGPRSEGRLPIDVYPTYKLLKEQEDEWVKKGRVGVAWPRDSKDPRLAYTGPLTLPSFPSPYPTLPFSYRARRLKSFIPFQSLPSRVTVHDPWNLLAMSSPGSSLGETVTSAPGKTDDWKEVEDKIHIYRLRVIDDGMKEMYEWYERIHPEQEWAVRELGRTMRGIEKGEEKGEWKVTWTNEKDVKVYFKNAHIQLSTGFFPFLPSLSSSLSTSPSSPTSSSTRIPPPIYLIHYPPPPPLPLTLPRRQPNFSGIRPLGENTHVYFTPAKKAGDGHHSRAYKVEWVMPRGVVYPRGEDGMMGSGSDESNEGGDEYEGEEGGGEGEEKDYVLCKKCLLDDMWREIEVLRASEDSDVLIDELGTLTREEILTSRSHSYSETAEEVDGEVEEAGEAKEKGEAKEDKKEKEEKEKEEQKPSEEDSKEDDSDADKSEDSWVEVSSNDVIASPKATSVDGLEAQDTSTLTVVDSDGPTLPSLSPSSPVTETNTSSDSSSTLPRVDSTPTTEDDGKEKEKAGEKKNKRYLYTYTGPLRSITIKTLYQDRMRPKCVHRDPLHSVPPPTSPSSTIPSSQLEPSEAEGPSSTPTPTLSSALPTPPTPVVAEMKTPEVSPTTTLRALAKLTYGPGYSPQCGHSGCSGSSSDHRRHMRREVWCYEWFGKDLSGDDDAVGGEKGGKEGKEGKKGKGWKRGGKDKEVDMFLHWGKKPKMRVKAKPTVEEKEEDEKAEEAKLDEVKPSEETITKEVEPTPAPPAEATNAEESTAAPALADETKEEEEPKPAVVGESTNPVEATQPTNDAVPPADAVTPADPPTEAKPNSADAGGQLVDATAATADEVEKVGEEGKPIAVEDAVVVGEEDAKDAEGKDEVKEVVEETNDQEPNANDEPKVEAEVEAPVAEAKEAGKEVETKEEHAKAEAKEETALVEEEVKQEPTEAAQPTDPPANPEVAEASEDTKEEAKGKSALAKEAEVKQEATETVQATDPTPANPDTTDAPANPDTVDPPANPEPTNVEPVPTNEPDVKPTDAPEPNPDPPTETSLPTNTVPPTNPPPQSSLPPKEEEGELEYEYEYETDPDDEDEGDIELGAILPRYYGYWVHDEECECRVVGREEKEEVKKEEKVEEKKDVEKKADEADEAKVGGKEVGKDGEVKAEEVEKKEQKGDEKKGEEEAKKEGPIAKEADTEKDGKVVEAEDEVKETTNPPAEDANPAVDTIDVADPSPAKDYLPQPNPTIETAPAAPVVDAEKVEGGEAREEEDKDIVMVDAVKEVDEETPKVAEATTPETLPPPNPEVVDPPTEKVDAEVVVVEKTEVAEEKLDEAKVEELKAVEGAEETEDIPAEQPKVEEEPPKDDTNTALDNIPPPDVTPDELAVDKKLELGAPDEAKQDEEEDKVVEEETKNEENKEEVVEEKKDEVVEETEEQEKKDEVVEEKKEDVVEEEEKEDAVEEKKDEVAEEKKEEVVEEKKPEEPKKKEKGYFSDILLLENCGWPVDNIRLRTDEKKQIHSLFSRFHSYGWTHHSPWKRNVVYHWGPVNKHMGHRKTDRDNRQLSFRVIDFGRARYHAGYDGKGTPGVDWDDKYEGASDRKAKWERATKSEMGDVRDEFVL